MEIAVQAKPPLQVRRRLWYHHADKPRLEVLTPRGWRSVRSYAEARRIAREEGRDGIEVTVI